MCDSHSENMALCTDYDVLQGMHVCPSLMFLDLYMWNNCKHKYMITPSPAQYVWLQKLMKKKEC